MQETFGYLFCPTQVNILKKFANFLLDEACWSFMCPVYITCIRCGREKENVLSCMACTVGRYMYLWAAIFSSSFFLLLANSEYLLLPTFSSSECAAQADSPFLSALWKKNLFFSFGRRCDSHIDRWTKEQLPHEVREPVKLRIADGLLTTKKMLNYIVKDLYLSLPKPVKLDTLEQFPSARLH